MAASLAAYREWLGPFRDIFFLLALSLVARSHYLYWGGLKKQAKWVTTITLWISTALTLVMIAVFYVYENPMFFG